MMICRGDIFYINNSRGQVGSETKKDRPGIIISNDMNNCYNREVTVVFLTSKPKKKTPTHVTINSVRQKSTALCEAPTSIDKMRLENYLGRATEKEMAGISKALKVALGLE